MLIRFISFDQPGTSGLCFSIGINGLPVKEAIPGRSHGQRHLWQQY